MNRHDLLAVIAIAVCVVVLTVLVTFVGVGIRNINQVCAATHTTCTLQIGEHL